MSDDPSHDVVDYYERVLDEAGRLSTTALGRLEFERTVSLLQRHLPPAPATVLDVGGGTGIHADWLARAGWDVSLFDIVPSHVAAAQVALPHVPATVADARDLPVADASADAVLVLGPLYHHLVERADRLAALAEARRVTRPGGVLAAAAIGRYAELVSLAVDGDLDARTAPAVERGLVTGVHDVGLGFTTACFHDPTQLATEVIEAGWDDVAVLGVEGPSWPAVRALPPDADLAPHLRAADLTDAYAEAAAVSSHLLAFARRG